MVDISGVAETAGRTCPARHQTDPAHQRLVPAAEPKPPGASNAGIPTSFRRRDLDLRSGDAVASGPSSPIVAFSRALRSGTPPPSPRQRPSTISAPPPSIARTRPSRRGDRGGAGPGRQDEDRRLRSAGRRGQGPDRQARRARRLRRGAESSARPQPVRPRKRRPSTTPTTSRQRSCHNATRCCSTSDRSCDVTDT